MHRTQIARRARKARQEAIRLFQSLRHTTRFKTRGAVKIIYPQRFKTGTCFIAALIPIDENTSLREIAEAGRAHQGYHYEPRILNNKDGTFLRLAYRFKSIQHDETRRLLEYATVLAKWAEGAFGRPAIVYPAKGVIAVRLRLRACT